MKKIDKLAILCILALAASCGQKIDPVPEGPANPHIRQETPAETHTLTFVLPSYPLEEGEEVPRGLKTAWEAGDQIIVHGEYADEQVTVTLASGDISSDGKTATKTVDGLHPYQRSDCASTLYAAYPAQAVQSLSHCMFYTSFANTNTQIMAACNDGDSFQFQNLSGVVSFKVSGDYDSFTLTGRKDVMLSYELFQIKITDKESNLKQYLQRPATTIESTNLVADGETMNYVYIPGDVDLKGGFILRFYKDGKPIKGLTDKSPINLRAGKGLAMGDVTHLLVDAADDIDPSLATPLDTDGHANCYIVYQTGLYRFNTVKGNTETALSGVTDAVVLWETYCDNQEVEQRSVIAGVTFDSESGSICFQLPDPVKPGNALVAAIDKDENILWSWHIWIPETTITVDSHGMGAFKMMSRNLGALVDTKTGEKADSRSFGLLYQWGRKDPFLGARALDSTEPVTFVGNAMKVVEGVIDPDASIDKPTTFINVDGAWATGNDNMMWGDVERDEKAVKSIYDPCPPGYRIPGRKRFNIYNESSGSSLAGFSYDAENGFCTQGTPSAVFPITGYMTNDGTLVNGSSIMWDSRNDYENGKVSYCMFIDSNNTKKTGKTRAYGGSVRCEAE